MPKNVSVTGITLDRDRVLLYRVRDVYDLEAALGNESIEDAISKRGYRRLVAFLTFGLRHQDERLTQQKTIQALERSALDYGEAWNKVAEALVASGLLPQPGAGLGDDHAIPTLAPNGGATPA